jgi:small-conductance mechanosensitive channel
MFGDIDINQLLQWVIPVGIALGGLLIGLFVEWVIIRALSRMALKSKARWDDVLAKSSKLIFATLIFIGGLWIAIVYAPFSEGTEATALNLLNGLATFIVILFIARFAAGFASLGMEKVGTGLASTSLISISTKAIILLIGVVFILDNTFHIELGPIFAALGIGGLAAALALQDTLSNLFSGFQIIATRQVRVGDYVRLENGELGYVKDINWRNVTIQSHPDENMIIVPNSRLATTVMINYNLPNRQLMEVVEVGVAYDSDLEEVERISLDVALETIEAVSGKKPKRDPQIRFREFGDFAITYQVRMFLPQLKGRASYKSEFIKRLHKRFKAEGIEIPFPIRDVYLHKESD